MWEYFGAGYASPALQGVSTFFYSTALVLPFADDFAGGSQHPVSDPTNTGGLLCMPTCPCRHLVLIAMNFDSYSCCIPVSRGSRTAQRRM